MPYRQKSSFEAAELDGEWVILNTDKFTVTKINQVGGFCWSLLQEGQTVETLAKAVMENFSGEIPENEIRKDVEEFLDKLHQYELIDHVD